MFYALFSAGRPVKHGSEALMAACEQNSSMSSIASSLVLLLRM